jgi:hypothetical protein
MTEKGCDFNDLRDVIAADNSGNTSEEVCEILVVNPGKDK